jgi:hypothetical protein
MAGMKMDDTQDETASEQRADVETLGQPAEACAHCMSHSQPPALSALLREAGRSVRDEVVTLASPASKSVNIADVFTNMPAANEHSPPAANGSTRHVLISVFRI